jgi:hypothetical protein
MGHWDVTDMGGILTEAHELVEKGLIDDDDFRDFVCNNLIRFYTRANPGFFDRTRIEQTARALVQEMRAT